jgi:molybdopterin-guanine dinucleotide biosynthesis protein A
MPFVTTELFGHLVARVQSLDAAVPRTSQGMHPLCAAYGRQCLAAVTRCLDEGRLAMKDLLRELHVRVVDETELDQFGDPRRLLANVNTPDEYARLAGPHSRHDK